MKIICVYILVVVGACLEYSTNYGHHKTMKLMKMQSRHKIKSRIKLNIRKKNRSIATNKNRNRKMNKNRHKLVFGKAKTNTQKIQVSKDSQQQQQSFIRQPYIQINQPYQKDQQQRLNKQNNTQLQPQQDEQTEDVVYLRDQEDPTKIKATVKEGYLENQDQKYSDYQKTASSRDIYANYKVGDFYLIQKPVYNKQQLKYGRFTFYLNHNAFYFTGIDEGNDYRGIINSINIDELVDRDEVDLIAEGVCCHNIGKIEQWHQLSLKKYDQSQLNEQDKYFVDSYKKQSEQDGRYRSINPEIKRLVENQFFWQGMYCFAINMKVYGRVVGNYWTVCSFSDYNIELLNMRIREVIVTNELRKRGVYSVEFVVTDRLQNNNHQRLGKIDVRDHQWQYGQEQQWPDTCQIRVNNGHIQSPIQIRDDIFPEIKVNSYIYY